MPNRMDERTCKRCEQIADVLKNSLLQPGQKLKPVVCLICEPTFRASKRRACATSTVAEGGQKATTVDPTKPKPASKVTNNTAKQVTDEAQSNATTQDLIWKEGWRVGHMAGWKLGWEEGKKDGEKQGKKIEKQAKEQRQRDEAIWKNGWQAGWQMGWETGWYSGYKARDVPDWNRQGAEPAEEREDLCKQATRLADQAHLKIKQFVEIIILRRKHPQRIYKWDSVSEPLSTVESLTVAKGDEGLPKVICM